MSSNKITAGYKQWINFLSFLIISVLFLSLALFLRSWGVHVDENVYLGPDIGRYGGTGLFGDSVFTGKPFFFYAFNYLWVTEIGHYFGRFKYISIYWLYITLHSAGVSYLCISADILPRQRIYLLFLLLITPLLVLSAVQPMNESLIIPAILMLFGVLLRISSGVNTTVNKINAYVLSLFLGLIKITAVPAVLLLTALFYRKISSGTLLGIITASLAGLIFDRIVVSQVAVHQVYYGSFFEIINDIDLKIYAISEFTWGIIFLLSPAAVLLVAIMYFLGPWKIILTKKSYLRLLFITYLITILILFTQNSAHGFFIRHAYPSLIVAVTATSIIIAQRFVTFMPQAVSNVLFLSSLFGLIVSPMDIWPKLIRKELYESGWTVLPGPPLVRWATFSDYNMLKNLCIFIPEKNSEHAEMQSAYLRKISPMTRLFKDEESFESDNCPIRGYIIREYRQDSPFCSLSCPQGGVFRQSSCIVQNISGWNEGPGGYLHNLICLP